MFKDIYYVDNICLQNTITFDLCLFYAFYFFCQIVSLLCFYCLLKTRSFVAPLSLFLYPVLRKLSLRKDGIFLYTFYIKEVI